MCWVYQQANDLRGNQGCLNDYVSPSLGFAAGSTPLGMYRKLVEFHKENKLSFKYVKTFNMDEYVGMATLR